MFITEAAATGFIEFFDPSQFPIDSNSFLALFTVAKLIGFPISSASIERIRTSLRFNDCSTAASKLRALPCQSINDPLFSTTAATGNTTEAISVISLCLISRDTTNFFASFIFASAEISIGSTPPIKTACRSELIISLELIPTSLGSESIFQAVAISTLADASVIARLPGSKFGSAPAAIAPFSPALRGIQPNFAPLSFTNLITADKAPVVSAARSPTKITDLAVNPLNVEIAATSLPVAVLINFAFSF